LMKHTGQKTKKKRGPAAKPYYSPIYDPVGETDQNAGRVY
jgi:hypothetical protein